MYLVFIYSTSVFLCHLVARVPLEGLWQEMCSGWCRMATRAPPAIRASQLLLGHRAARWFLLNKKMRVSLLSPAAPKKNVLKTPHNSSLGSELLERFLRFLQLAEPTNFCWDTGLQGGFCLTKKGEDPFCHQNLLKKYINLPNNSLFGSERLERFRRDVWKLGEAHQNTRAGEIVGWLLFGWHWGRWPLVLAEGRGRWPLWKLPHGSGSSGRRGWGYRPCFAAQQCLYDEAPAGKHPLTVGIGIGSGARRRTTVPPMTAMVCGELGRMCLVVSELGWKQARAQKKKERR